MRPERPEEFGTERADCTVYTLAAVAGMPYGAAHEELRRAGRKNRCGFRTADFLKFKGWKVANYDVEEIPQEFFRALGTVGSFVRTHPTGRYIIRTNGHVMALVEGELIDMANVGKKTVVRSAYVLKPR